jgi:transposase
MIVIGVDVHKHSLTAVAVDELGRAVAERTSAVSGEALLEWADSLQAERLWALEDCRHVTRGLERALLAADERLVRVPPRLTAPERRRGRSRGKSDSLDALAIARAALREPRLEGPRPEEPLLRELKLLVDHRDDLVAERRRCQQRLRWHLHELDAPGLLALPSCGALSAAKLLCEIGPIARFRSDAQLARHAGVAPLEASSGKQRRHRLDRGGNRQLNCALHRIAITQGRVHPPARAYLERKQNEGKSRREAIRCLKRQLARTIYTTLKSESALT